MRDARTLMSCGHKGAKNRLRDSAYLQNCTVSEARLET